MTWDAAFVATPFDPLLAPRNKIRNRRNLPA
jgi:hypothetical protein